MSKPRQPSPDFDRRLVPDTAPVELLDLPPLAVGPFVNSARHEGPGCVEPAGGAPLFDWPLN